MSFESVRDSSLPVWLYGAEARAHQGAVGAEQDGLVAGVKAAVKLGHACLGCIEPVDDAALFHAGEERRLLRAPNEPGAAYLERMQRSWSIWYWGGTNDGLAQVFEPFYRDWGFVPATTDLRRLEPARDAALIDLQRMHGRVNPFYWHAENPPTCEHIRVYNNGAIDWDGNTDWFSRVFIFLDSSWQDPGGPWQCDSQWDQAGDYDDGGLWDTTMTAFEATYIRTMIRRMKSPGAYPTTVAVWLPGLPFDGFWGSPGDYDDGGLWEAENDSDPLYLTIGHVWGEEAWLGAAGEYPLVEIWPAEDDGLGGFIAFEEDPWPR